MQTLPALVPAAFGCTPSLAAKDHLEGGFFSLSLFPPNCHASPSFLVKLMQTKPHSYPASRLATKPRASLSCQSLTSQSLRLWKPEANFQMLRTIVSFSWWGSRGLARTHMFRANPSFIYSTRTYQICMEPLLHLRHERKKSRQCPCWDSELINTQKSENMICIREEVHRALW